MNRTLAPAFKEIDQIKLIQAEPLNMDNGLNAYMVNAGEQELVRIEFIFNHVDACPDKPLLIHAVNTMLHSGTSEMSAVQIAERIDYHGAFLETTSNQDYSYVTVYVLNKHLSAILPIVKAVLTDSIFPQDELDIFTKNEQQKLSVRLRKNDFICRRAFSKALFGEHLYGFSPSIADYEHIDRNALINYFHAIYHAKACNLVVSGKVTSETSQLINRFFGKDWAFGNLFSKKPLAFVQGVGVENYIEKPDSLQTALRIGQLCVNRQHEDYAGLKVLNTVLGGYFGSRLMANIREDKGYTYGIGSAIVPLKYACYFFIASEVGAQVCQPALAEIEREINLLKNQLISIEELELVKNYMLGSILGSLENAFSHADKFKDIYLSGLGYDFYDRFVQTIKTVSPERLRELANQYLDFEKMEKVIVGKKE